MVIELCVVQFWSEIILVMQIELVFEITRMISDQIALHSVQLPLFIGKKKAGLTTIFPGTHKITYIAGPYLDIVTMC